MPRSASATTSAGSLMSFFIVSPGSRWLPDGRSAAGLGAPVGRVRGPRGGGLVPAAGLVELRVGGGAAGLLVLVGDRQVAADDGVVQPCAQETADQWADDRHPEVDVPV